MARKSAQFLYAGTGRFVLALDPTTGAEVWRTKLPHSTGNIVTLLVTKDCLFVGHAGRAYALNPRNGEITWDNGLPHTGYAAVMLAMEGASMGCGPAVAAAQAEADAAAAAASG